MEKWSLKICITGRVMRCAICILLSTFVLAASLPALATEFKDRPPSTDTKSGPRPSTIIKRLSEEQPPELSGKGEVARKNALAFIAWAAASTKAQAELVRKALSDARDNKDIMAAFCDEAFASQVSDHSRALIVLSLIGEAKGTFSEKCLVKFIQQPFPEKGTVVEGEILEQTALATLQAKAVDGLAYLHSESADRFVLDAVAKHPSRIVRAEAIAAYLWNHEYSASARETLKSYVHKDELILLDRVVRQEGERRESFNRKLSAYLKAHPEVRPPDPAKAQSKPRPAVGEPPKF